MKRSAVIGLIGGLTSLGLWLLTAFSCSCAVPPEYRKPIYPVDPSELLSGPFGQVVYLGIPLIAILSAVAALLFLLPRFRTRNLPRLEIGFGFALVVFLCLMAMVTQKPHDMSAFLLSLISVIPGVLVLASGLLARRVSTTQLA